MITIKVDDDGRVVAFSSGDGGYLTDGVIIDTIPDGYTEDDLAQLTGWKYVGGELYFEGGDAT